MECPKCGAEMEILDFKGVEIDRCTRCRGIWFDRLEVESMKELEGVASIDIGLGANEELNDQLFVECPRCFSILDQRVEYDIKYELCLSCYGTFFDAGEFRQYLQGSANLESG